jgi:hypothetical protein
MALPPCTQIVFLLVLSVSAMAQDSSFWPSTPEARQQAFALVEKLREDLLTTRSSTLTLEAWCRDHRLAKDPTIVADVVKSVAKKPSAAQRTRLQISPKDEVKYRRVRLRCGERVLAEADNWYLAGRLTPEMNRLLETTDTPFGKVVAPLEPYRKTFDSQMLWSPVPGPWQLGPDVTSNGGTLAIPSSLFEDRAVLFTREQQPFSEVYEVYERPLLAFPPPR